MGIVEILEALVRGIHSEIWPWFNPGSRLYIFNILGALFISLCFLLRYQHIKLSDLLSKNYWQGVLKNYWLHPSAIVDYQIYFMNALIKVVFFAPVLGLSFYFSKYTVKFLYFLIPDFSTLSGSWGLYFVLTVFAFVWDDFLRFFHHYLMHKIPFLWTIHKTHHSAEVLTPVTLFRIHPLESLLASIRNSLSYGVTSGLVMFLVSGQVNFMTVLGVNIFGFFFNLITGNLRHSQIPISFGVFEYILISPKQHQIHHSNNQRHFDKNFGVALSIWDLLFGSFLHSKGEVIKSYGVDNMSAISLGEQFWPWKGSLNKTKTQIKTFEHKTQTLESYYKKAMGTFFKALCLGVLFFLPMGVKASTCTHYIETQQLFVEGRIITVSAGNLSVNLKSYIPGVYLATVEYPQQGVSRTFPAYFNDYDMEVKFNQIRHPRTQELSGMLVSGRLAWFENEEAGISELTLFIEKMWRRDPRWIDDSSTRKILSFSKP